MTPSDNPQRVVGRMSKKHVGKSQPEWAEIKQENFKKRNV